MEEVKSNSGWNLLNTLLGVGGLATALGVGIPAIVKANDAENENGCSENTKVTRYEMAQAQEIATLKSDKYTDEKIIEAYKQSVADNKALEAKISDLETRNSAAHETIYKGLVAQRESQLVTNANFDKEIALNKQRDYFIEKLNDSRFVKAKKVVAKDDICPEVMERYNSWTAPTNTATTAG